MWTISYKYLYVKFATTLKMTSLSSHFEGFRNLNLKKVKAILIGIRYLKFKRLSFHY